MDLADRYLLVSTVRAKEPIRDTPLAKRPAGARRGALGQVVDVVPCDSLVFVDFGGGSIPCSPDEIVVVAEIPRSTLHA